MTVAVHQPPAKGIDGRWWTTAAYAYGLVVAAVLGYFLLGLPVQVSDSFGNLLAIQRPTLAEILADQFARRAYLRPLLWAQMKLVYEASGGHYYEWFRGIHVAQVGVLIALCIRLMRPRSARDFAVLPLALAALVGAHTFTPTVREAFPINSFLTVLLACAAVANIALGERPRWWTDAAAVLLFAIVALTVETGLLIWVVAAAVWLLGGKGLSRAGVVTMTACLVAYFVARAWLLDVGGPWLTERSSGFGFNTLEPGQLAAKFGSFPWSFYAYNVVSSAATVLFAEPKGGVWRFVYELTTGQVHPWTAVSVASSTATTAIVAWFLWTRRQRLLSWTLERDDRLVLLFVIVLAANAVISYPYTKNVIMSPAGMFLAIALFAASRRWFEAPTGHVEGRAKHGALRAVVTVALFAIVSCGWAFRELGMHHTLRYSALLEHNQWVTIDDWLAQQRMTLHDEQAVVLREALRRSAITEHPAPPQFSGPWSQWIDIDW